jgi:hypothetical protein
MEYRRPVILIYEGPGEYPGLSEIKSGIEEEGVPFKAVRYSEKASLQELSLMAARQSSMEAGIGICDEGACFCSITGGQVLFLLREAAGGREALRALGSNAGRFVKKKSLRQNNQDNRW